MGAPGQSMAHDFELFKSRVYLRNVNVLHTICLFGEALFIKVFMPIATNIRDGSYHGLD